ncbi:MAG TPA: SDR family NAD(P)-dependent oxidoreductase [Candidatus Acidoferrales bacterium]|jgi:dehydrogenase/reductase SDR family protein 1|nr:SDR family NAD(P)-dependent oxidoreductase [Candidatus Acidoferrales bacterium]
MNRLKNKIALVTGATRGIGRGVALGLGEVGATVYLTGRTVEEGLSVDGLPGTIHSTAADVAALGGVGIGLPCDHRNDEETRAVFRRIASDAGRIDILVNSAWGGYERMIEDGEFTWTRPFWEQPVWRWDAMFDAGTRACYIASAEAAKIMVAQKNGLIVNVSFWASQRYIGNVPYGAAKAATDKMTRDMAQELRPFGVAVVSLYPGLVRTESVMRFAQFLDLSNSESPQFIGRAVAALAGDPESLRRTGRTLIAAEVAAEFGLTDIDGSRPKALTLETVQ